METSSFLQTHGFFREAAGTIVHKLLMYITVWTLRDKFSNGNSRTVICENLDEYSSGRLD